MENFEKNVYMQGCHLMVRMFGDISDTYQFVFNEETGEFSDIYVCEQLMDYELDADGPYMIVTFKNESATLSDNRIQIGEKNYDAKTLYNVIKAPIWLLGETTYDEHETLSIGLLKKCVASLELEQIQNSLSGCKINTCKKNENRAQLDFLFIAVWLMEHLVNTGNVDGALSIYASIQSCGSICNNLSKSKTNCGCNG